MPQQASHREWCEPILRRSRLKEQHRILTSVDGPHDNVIVIKPPLAFTLANASTLITALDEVLSNLGAVDPNTKRTPT